MPVITSGWNGGGNRMRGGMAWSRASILFFGNKRFRTGVVTVLCSD